uniref:Uncharacterized protein n=1 Tax=Rhizophora mucronata TaxID=61149 RepID=A0A2P2QTU2_RHIMU
MKNKTPSVELGLPKILLILVRIKIYAVR